ncbi:hypothetical protein FACS189449_06240 [Alphaproteobacteria bacterium]|nr:hypothetical protein FACS189449_06240 [Alphaproteobacteria bacterium]
MEQIEQATAGRIVSVKVTVWTFTNETREINIDVLDVCADSVRKIFWWLFKIRFPVYRASGHDPRLIVRGTKPSLHASGLAVDVNDTMNPYYDAVEHVIIPERLADRGADRKRIEGELRDELKLPELEVRAVLERIIQEEGSDDWFLNRGVFRDGMVTDLVVAIFRLHGFDIWGGKWRQPMDYMHFQCSRSLAEQLLPVPYDKSSEIWRKHVANCSGGMWKTRWGMFFHLTVSTLTRCWNRFGVSKK